MPDSVVPDPEFQPRDELAQRRGEAARTPLQARADREASAVLAELEPVSPDAVHGVVALAWLRGYLGGYDRCAALVGGILHSGRRGVES